MSDRKGGIAFVHPDEYVVTVPASGPAVRYFSVVRRVAAS
jgi:hypothetical protein